MLRGRPMAVRRGPRLIGTAARTAVVAGTATAVSGGVSRRQQAKAASQQAAADEQAQAAQAQAAQAAQAQQMQMTHDDSAAAGAGGISEAAMAKLEQLADLKKQGILTDEEFAAQKAKILA